MLTDSVVSPSRCGSFALSAAMAIGQALFGYVDAEGSLLLASDSWVYKYPNINRTATNSLIARDNKLCTPSVYGGAVAAMGPSFPTAAAVKVIVSSAVGEVSAHQACSARAANMLLDLGLTCALCVAAAAAAATGAATGLSST